MLGVAHNALGFQVYQRRAVGAGDLEFFVIQVVFVDQQVCHSQGNGGIGAGANGNPFVGLFGSARHVRVETTALQPFARLSAKIFAVMLVPWRVATPAWVPNCIRYLMLP